MCDILRDVVSLTRVYGLGFSVSCLRFSVYGIQFSVYI